jgi:hypothetical protein
MRFAFANGVMQVFLDFFGFYSHYFIGMGHAENKS